VDTRIGTKIRIRKPAVEVFEAIVDPEKIGNYWFSSSSERWEQGKKIILRYDEYQAEGTINVLEIQENKKIVFSWGAESGEETVVTITLKELEPVLTVIEVIEVGLNENDPEVVNKMLGQKEGWVYAFTCLKAYLENGTTDLRASLIH